MKITMQMITTQSIGTKTKNTFFEAKCDSLSTHHPDSTIALGRLVEKMIDGLVIEFELLPPMDTTPPAAPEPEKAGAT